MNLFLFYRDMFFSKFNIHPKEKRYFVRGNHILLIPCFSFFCGEMPEDNIKIAYFLGSPHV